MQPARPTAAQPGKTAFDLLSGAGRALLDLFFPHRCPGCGRLGVLFCDACRARIEPYPNHSACSRCDSPEVPGLSLACSSAPSALDGIRATAVFKPPIQEAIHDLKYNGVRDLAEPLGERMAVFWPETGPRADVLVPVPLHRRRQMERGYNQSALLAHVLGRRLGITVDESLLIRSRATLPQVGLGPGERQGNVAGAFACSGNAAGRSVVLVDDVCTTGATLEACAQALRSAGASSVWGYTLSRARGTPARES